MLATALAVAFFAQTLLGGQGKSLTWDEPSFISAGCTYLLWEDFHLDPSQRGDRCWLHDGRDAGSDAFR